MDQYKEYLPRDKHDMERVKDLKNLSREEILPLLPGLMEWIQDMNWPIAAEVASLLLTYPDEIVPLIKDVLGTDDDVWKYWCLIKLVDKLPEKSKEFFKKDLIRLMERPTVGEKAEELDEIAIGILERMQ